MAESMHTYRHHVDEETKQIFLESAQRVIKQKKYDKIGFLGIVGSHKEEFSHDIDVLIFPDVKATIGDAILQVTQFYNEVEALIKEKHHRYYISIASKKSAQETIYYLAALQEGSPGLIPIHSLFYTDETSFVNLNPVNFREEIAKTLITLKGSFDIISKLPVKDQKLLDPYFSILEFELLERVKNLPNHLGRSSAESLFHYLRSKYRIKLLRESHHESDEIEEELRNILTQLDERTYR